VFLCFRVLNEPSFDTCAAQALPLKKKCFMRFELIVTVGAGRGMQECPFIDIVPENTTIDRLSKLYIENCN
jgi:hypothetical protein